MYKSLCCREQKSKKNRIYFFSHSSLRDREDEKLGNAQVNNVRRLNEYRFAMNIGGEQASCTCKEMQHAKPWYEAQAEKTDNQAKKG
jgi:hypothetical protein